MNLAIELLCVGVVVPATIAAVVAWGALKFRSARLVQIYALPAAAAIAFVAAYVLLPEWAAIKPEGHWQWLPYLAASAALAGPAALLGDRASWVRWIVVGGLAVAAAFLLVPRWDNLRPPWPVSIVLLSVYLGSSMLALDWLAPRLPVAWLLALMSFAGGMLAAALAIDVVRYGQLAGIAAAVLGGCWLATAIDRGSPAADLRGLTPLFAVLVGGMAYVGCIEPEQPTWWLLLLPALALPLGLVVAKFRPYRASASSAQ